MRMPQSAATSPADHVDRKNNWAKGLAWHGKSGRKAFFSEEKKQKTFIPFSAASIASTAVLRHGGRPTALSAAPANP
jgi:hypothetical protein